MQDYFFSRNANYRGNEKMGVQVSESEFEKIGTWASEGLSWRTFADPKKSDLNWKNSPNFREFFVIFGDPFRRLAKKKTRPRLVTIGWGNQMGNPLFRASCALNLCLKGKEIYRNDSERMVKDGEGFFLCISLSLYIYINSCYLCFLVICHKSRRFLHAKRGSSKDYSP